MVARPGCQPLTVGRVARAVEVQRYPHDLEVAEDLAFGLPLDLLDDRSIDRATSGALSRSHSPSNRDGIASYSSALMLTMPVTWLTAPS